MTYGQTPPAGTGTKEAAIPQPHCACCGMGSLKLTAFDYDLSGPVCEDCRRRLLGAAAWLVHIGRVAGIVGCSKGFQTRPGLEGIA
jgi:hypothetical protein